MKVLTFDTEAKFEYYQIIYEGLCMTSKQPTGREVRRLDKIFVILESVGVKSGEKIGTIPFYKLETPAVIELEDADYEYIKAALEPPNVPWNGAGQRKAGRMLTWLDSVPNKEMKPELVT